MKNKLLYVIIGLVLLANALLIYMICTNKNNDNKLVNEPEKEISQENKEELSSTISSKKFKLMTCEFYNIDAEVKDGRVVLSGTFNDNPKKTVQLRIEKADGVKAIYQNGFMECMQVYLYVITDDGTLLQIKNPYQFIEESEYKDGDIVNISAGVEHPKVTVLHGNVEDILEDYTFYNEERKFSSLYLKVYTKDKNIIDVLYRRFYPPAYWMDSQ